jgi:hypothetical protein
MIQDSGPTAAGRAPLSHGRSCSRPHSSISGIASGLTWTVLQIGTATGLAPLVGIAAANVTDDASQSAVADGLQTVLCVIAAALALPTAATPPATRRSATRRATRTESARPCRRAGRPMCWRPDTSLPSMEPFSRLWRR